MSGSRNTTAEWAPRLEDVVAEYERSTALGQSPDITELLDHHPDLASELEEYFANREYVEQIAAPLRIAVNGPDRISDFGEYEALEEIGCGGMAVVYKARHKSLDCLVALKFIRSGPFAKPEDKARFQAEAKNLAGLKQSNIVVIHDIGEHDGRPYLCLEFMEGGSLAQRIADGVPRPNREAAQLLRTLARAVHYAHQHRIIHRDLKPANVLFSGKDDEEVAKIADFGLAKRLDDEGPALSEAVVGTVNYMAPEQIDLEHGSIGAATDVWALGVILYQLLTGRPPFQAATPGDTLQQVVDYDPVAPRRLNRKVDRDLETICLKCLKKEPQKRFSSADKLAQNLGAYLDGKPLPDAGIWERAIKWIRRRPALAASLACSVFLAVTAIGLVDHIRTERRVNAIENALDALRDCKLDEADRALIEAKRRCGLSGQVRRLHGWLAIARGRPGQAIEHLEKARTELPKSAATLAMLAVAFNHAGQFGEYERTLAELKDLPLNTHDDFLWRGRAESFSDPIRARITLHEAIKRENSVVGRLTRSGVLTRCATLTGIPTYAELACKDALVAKEMSPDNPLALSASVQAHVVAARLFEETGQEQKHAHAEAEAGNDVQALAGFAALPIAALARWSYFDYREDEDAALETLRYANEHDPTNPWIAQLYALALYRHGNFGEALDVSEKIEERSGGTVFFALARTHVLAEQPPDGPARARKALANVADRNGLLGVFLSTTLCLLEGKQTAMEFAQEVEGETVPLWRNGWYHQLLEYNRGRLEVDDAETPEDALLGLAGNSLWNQCEAHYFIALNLLGEGNRLGARKHFLKSVDTDVNHYFAHQWSRAFLTRMDEDEGWPSRIE